jgi:hypothetical protein
MTTERLWGLFLMVPYAVNNYMALKNDKNTFDIKYFNKKGQDHDGPALEINNLIPVLNQSAIFLLAT